MVVAQRLSTTTQSPSTARSVDDLRTGWATRPRHQPRQSTDWRGIAFPEHAQRQNAGGPIDAAPRDQLPRPAGDPPRPGLDAGALSPTPLALGCHGQAGYRKKAT